MGTSIRDRVGTYRARMRDAGMRPVQIWVPDTRRPNFAEECRRQSASLQNDPQEVEISEWLERAGDDDGWQ